MLKKIRVRMRIYHRLLYFVPGNSLITLSPLQMDRLNEKHIILNQEHLNEKEKLTVIRGMKEIKKLANKIPYSPPDEEDA